MKTILACLLLLLLTTPVHAEIAEYAPYVEGLFVTETMIDWDQTRRFLKDPDHSQEANPVLGHQPKQSTMTYFGVTGVAIQYGVYEWLPDNYKLPYVSICATLEGINVYNNERLLHYGYNVVAIGLGAIVTTYLVHDWNKTHKNTVSVAMDKIENTYMVKLSMAF